jgi:hypothetical protein
MRKIERGLFALNLFISQNNFDVSFCLHRPCHPARMVYTGTCERPLRHAQGKLRERHLRLHLRAGENLVRLSKTHLK